MDTDRSFQSKMTIKGPIIIAQPSHILADKMDGGGGDSETGEPGAHDYAERAGGMSVKELRKFITGAGLRSDDCIEKSELRERAVEAMILHQSDAEAAVAGMLSSSIHVI